MNSLSIDISRALDDPAAARELFKNVVEPLCDRFDRAGVDEYAELFRHVPGCDFWRFQRARQHRPCVGDADDVVVLSRVTLGADVAVTSVVLDMAKRRFSRARIWFAGPRKNFELFEGDPRIQHLPVNYARHATLRERLAAGRSLQVPSEAIVIDPDSRITQLGLLPVCPEYNYFFFESRSYGENTSNPLPVLTAHWCRDTFGTPDARAFVAPKSSLEGADTAVSLGTGGNDAKRFPDPFESRLITALAKKGSVLLDRGATEEEAQRADRASAGQAVRYWNGSFATFAGAISRSKSYAGYDSSGQHVAAACGVPLTVYFTGAINERFKQRWRPYGPGPITVEESPVIDSI